MHNKTYFAAIHQAQREFFVSSRLINAIISAESSWDPKAESAYARGLMQISKTALEQVNMSYNLNFSYDDMFNPDKNILAGTAYLRWLFKFFSKEPEEIQLILVIMAYNWGCGNVRKWLKTKQDNRVIDESVPTETKDYIVNVLFHMANIE